jgi:hypothetical protein
MGFFDLTPLAAILVLVVIQNIINTLSNYGVITFGIILAIILRAVWQSAVWILFFLVILCAVRMVGQLIGRAKGGAFWTTIDMMVQPLSRVWTKVLRRPIDYVPSLVLSIAFLLLSWFIGGWIIGRASQLLIQLPL